MRRTSRPADGAPVQGRAVNPTYSSNSCAPLCAAPQAARQAVAVGPCGRPRIPRYRCACTAKAFRSPSRSSLAATRSRGRHAVLCHGLCRGPHLLGAAFAGVDPAERAAIYDAANATIARLHSFDPAAIGLADYGRGENYVARQVERWSKQYRASQTRIDRRDGAADRLAAGPSAAAGAGAAGPWRFPARQHDPAPDAPNVLAVLDWELSDARRSAGGFLLSSDEMAHAGGRLRRRHRLSGRP